MMNYKWNTDDIIEHFTLLAPEISFLGSNDPHNHLGKALIQLVDIFIRVLKDIRLRAEYREERKLLIKPSRESIKRLLIKVRATIKANKQATAGDLIIRLNPVIRGWAHYHRHVVSKKVFSRVDTEIFKALWRWAKRRHNNKSRKWIMEKYFRPTPNHKWRFFGHASDKEGKTVTIYLTRAAEVPIRRHTKVKAHANPYDPQWESYFEKRLDTRMADKLWGKQQLFSLWRSQRGVCPICRQKITETTGWARHHIRWRSLGGGDTLDNLVLLHPTCHMQVHSRKLYVVKPRPSQGVREA